MREIPRCGTYTAYQRHRRLCEEPCEECRAANTDYYRRYRDKGKAQRPTLVLLRKGAEVPSWRRKGRAEQ